MEAASNAEPKRSYSWWWDSHITPKNSKWLQDNLTDMDNKIKAMIKLIEEDADSFARRAEMYYKKRPDLMKLVEEFYRAYRALAERYDHVTGALRQAHRTIAVAFPNQIQSTLPDEPPSGFPDNVDEDTSESDMQTTSDMQMSKAIQCDGKSLDEIVPFISNEGLKYLNWLFVDEDAHKKFSEFNWKKGEGKHFEYQKLEEENSDLSKENKILKNEVTLESQRADKAEAELQCLKDAISKLKTELESALLQYQISEERISSLESEISVSQAKCLNLNDEMDINASKLSITEERCLGLERENTSLKLKLDKVNLVVSKQQEEVSDLLNENQNLHNRLDSESRRADRAETDIFSSKDAVLRLKSEMESALLQNQLSQGRISDLEAEIFRTKEQFKNVNLEMSIRASKLNMAENQCLLLQEENKFLQRELDKFMKKVTNQGAEIIMREEELDRLEQSIEVERQHNIQAEIMENSLHTKVNKLEQIVKRQEEEIAIREQELNKLKQHVEDGWKQRLQSERAYQVLVELHSQTQENLRHLGLENQYGAEMLRKTELRTSALEEEIKRLRDENNSLNEENFTSVSRIICLQDELISLKAFKHKIHDELRFNAEEKLFLQQELSSYKNNRYDLEEGHHELIEKLRRMELREATFEEELRCLHDENIGLYEKFFQFSSKIVNLQDDIICLRESNSKLEEELQFHLEEKKVLQQDLFSLKSQKNVLGECNQELTEHNNEVNCNVITLHAMVKELQDENKELRDTCKKYEDKQNMLMESMEDKSAFLDISLSGANAELRNLLDKIKGLKEYSESLYDNVHSHISLEPVLISHFEAVTQNTVKLSEKHSVLENSISDLNVEFDVLRGMVKALEEPCQSLYYQNSHLIAENSNLVSQVEKVGLHLQSLENRFVVLEGKQVNTEEKNLTLYHIQEEHDDDICFFRNQLRALITQIHLVKKQNQITKEVLDEEDHFKTVKNEIDSFMFKQFLVDLNEKNMFLSKECWKYMEKLDLAENFIFELKEEWASQEVKLITMSDRNEKLLGGIHVMMKACDTKKASESYDTKKNFENSNDGYDKILQNILHRIVELHGTIAAAKGDIHNFQLEKSLSFTLLEQLALILTELRAQKNVLEQGSLLRNQEILVLHKKNHELMEINDRSWKDINASKQREDLLTLEMESICVRLLDLQEAFHASEGVNSKLVKENELLSKKPYDLRDQSDALKEENDAILEKAITQEQLSLIFRKYNAEKSSDIDWLIRDVNCLYRITNDLSQEIKMISKSKGAQEAEKKIQQALKALKKLDKEIETRKRLLEQSEVENNFFSLSEEENSCKDYKIGCLQTSNKLHKVVEMLGTKENDLTSELQVSIDECKFYKEATTKLLYDLHSSSFMELIFKEKFFELMEILKDLETVDIVQSKIRVEETGILNVQEDDLKGKLDALGRENKELKEELNAFVPLVVSLEKEIAYLEDHTLSLTNFHILSSKRKKGNILASFQRKKGSQIRATLPSPRASSGIFELKKLRAKVKGLQKEVTDTKGPLEQENTVSGTNETRKSKGLKSQKKKNIILDLRKGDNTGKDVKQLKEETFSKERQGQMIKDIELDHVLSNSQHQAVFNVETYNDHTLVVCEKERSKNPSSELVLEELNIDNLNYNKYLREWNDRVNVSLSAGSQRLLTLRNSMEELKMKIKTSEMKCQLSASELNTVKMQVKEVEESLIKFTDFNFKLTEATKTFSESSDSSKLRRKVEERIQRGMEKIDRLEMKLQKVQFVFVKFQEELQECRTLKSLERRSRLPLKDLIYGKKSDPKQMKRRFCACMRFKVKEK